MAKKKKRWSGVIYSTDPDYGYSADEQEVNETLSPSQQDLRILLDRKLKGGKKVTRIRNFIGQEADLKKLGKSLQQKCGCGGAVKNGEIMLQGDFREKAGNELKRLGYRFKFSGG